MTSERRQPDWVVFVAEGFGSGRLRPGPGTWGSIVGVVWFLLLLVPANAWAFGTGLVASTGLTVWVCGEAERRLNRHDPSSVVLDEIVAVPWCFLAPVILQTLAEGGRFPGPTGFLRAWPWWLVPAGFVAFRVFDIFKPWPIRALQRLPGGWGVVADDVAAAVVVAGLAWVGHLRGLGG